MPDFFLPTFICFVTNFQSIHYLCHLGAHWFGALYPKFLLNVESFR